MTFTFEKLDVYQKAVPVSPLTLLCPFPFTVEL